MRLTLVLSIFLALAVGIACNQAAAPNIKKASSPTPIAAAPPSDGHDHASEANVPRITVADAKKDFEAGKAIFIDTRDTSSFKFARIKGAINISPSTVETSLDKIPKDKKIIAYCSWQNEHTSVGLALTLNAKGFTNVYALLGGTQAWMDAGFPMEGEKFSQSNSNK